MSGNSLPSAGSLRRDREGLIQLKHAKDLIDPEIRLLKLACAIRFGTHGVELAASRGLAVCGRVFLRAGSANATCMVVGCTFT